jgi:hypothetical protein
MDSALAGVRFATTSAAGAQHQHALALQRHAGIEFDVAHQAHAVGVVPEPAVGLECDGVDGLGAPRPIAQARARGKGLALERHGDVAPAGSAVGERAHGGDELVQRRLDARVVHRVAGGGGEARVDLRRTAVGNRVADDGQAGERSGRHRKAFALRAAARSSSGGRTTTIFNLRCWSSWPACHRTG